MKKTTKKRMLSTLLTVSMLLSLLPMSVFAEGTPTVTLRAKYKDESQLSAINATDTSTIELSINLENLPATSGTTVAITLPVGISLTSANGYDSSGTAASYDTTNFTDFPTWESTGQINKTTTSGAGGYAISNSGTLTYPLLSTVSSTGFTIEVEVDPAFIQMNPDGSAMATSLGDITAELNVADSVSATLPVSVTSYAPDLRFTSLTAVETLPAALNNTVYQPNIMIGNVSKVTLSSSYMMNYSLGSCDYTQRAYAQSFTLNVPHNATVTSKFGLTGPDYNEETGIDAYTITVSGGNTFTTSGSCSFDNFATVDFSALPQTADTPFPVSVGDLHINVDQYVPSERAFISKQFTTTTDYDYDIPVLAQPSVADYAPTYSNFSSYVEQLNPGTGVVQTLFSTARNRSSSGITLNSWNPVKIEFISTATGTDGAYLDNVPKVVMSVPFLSDDDDLYPRHTSQLTSLTVRYEGDDTDTVLVLNDDFGINLGGNTSGISDIALDTTGIATYTVAASQAITFTAPNDKSFVYICAEFSGDNATYNSGNKSYVYGTPKSDDSTEAYSKYTFKTYIDDSEVDAEPNWVEKATVSGGFRWKAPLAFGLTLTPITSTKNYMYNTAEANTIITGYSGNAQSAGNLHGYHNLGFASLKNDSGTATTDNVIIDIQADTTNDVVKEIYFPLYNDGDTDQILSLEYTYTDGEKVTYTKGDATKPFISGSEDITAQLNLDTNPFPETFGIVRAEDDKELASLTVTLAPWGQETTTSYIMLKGYIRNTDDLNAGGQHTVTVSTQATDAEAVEVAQATINNRFQFPTSSPADMRVLGSANITSKSGSLISANEIGVGLTSFVDVTIMGGAFGNPYNGSLTDIVFNVVLPEGVTLTGATAHDWTYGYNGADYGSLVTTTETAGDITISPVSTISASSYYDAYDDIDTVNVYTCSLEDGVNLYGMRVSSGGTNANALSMFTVSLKLTADITTTPVEVPWSEVLVLGSSENANISVANSNWGQGTKATNAKDAFTSGIESSNVIKANSDQYLAITSSSQVMVHKGYITVDGDETQYRYNATDATTIPVLSNGDEGDIHFSVTNMQDLEVITAGYTTSYVLFALPTGADNELKPTNDASAASFGAPVFDTNSSNATVTPKYVTIPSGTVSGSTIKSLFASGSDSQDGQNGLLLEIKNQSRTSSIDVTIPFTMPTTIQNNITYAKFEGRSTYVFNSNGGEAIYYGGFTGTGDEKPASANNYLSFAYYYPEWDITYQGMKANANGTIDAFTLEANDSHTAVVADNSTLATAPATPSDVVNGYTFKGWYTDEALKHEASFPLTITKDTTLYAKFAEGSYHVTYEYEDTFTNAPVASTVDVNWTTALDLPAGATRKGYTFDGWYDGETKVAENTVFNTLSNSIDTETATVTLTGKYIATTYTVTYNLNGGSVTDDIDPVEYDWEDEFELPNTVPNLDGYTFDGWYTATTGGNKVTVTDTPSYGDMTAFADEETANVNLYAQWTEKSYIITFNTDGADTATPASITVDWTGTFTDLPDLPSKDGYTCDGWFYYATGDTTGVEVFNTNKYQNIIGVAGVATVDLKAKWIANEYELTFVDGIDSTHDTTRDLDYDEAVGALPTEPTKDGYTFDAWYTGESGAGEKITAATLYSDIAPTPAANMNVYVNWTAIEYTITYTLPSDSYLSGIEAPAVQTTTWDGESFSLSTPADVSGYTFLHWDWDDGSGNTATSHHPITIEANDTYGTTIGELTQASSVTLIAHYAAKAYNVNFSSTTTEFSKNSFNIGWSDYLVLDEKEIAGYTFDGWYTDSSYTTPVTSGTPLSTAFPDDADSSSVTIHAKYTKNKYTLEFIENGGSDQSNLDALYWDSDITSSTLPTPDKDGYTFAGWYEDSTCTDHHVNVTTDSTFGAVFGSDFGTQDATDTYKYTCTLYAKWTANSYKVSYNLNDGTGTPPSTQTLGWSDTMTAPDGTGFSKTGYTFVGWSKANDNDTDGILDFSDYKTTIGTDTHNLTTTLYAVWTTTSYTVTYDEQGGIADPAIADPSFAYTATFTPAVATNLKKAGFAFDAWYTGTNGTGTKAIEATYSTLFGNNNVTLYANWIAKDYTITFLNTGAETPPTAKDHWTDAIVVAAPSKTGYTFSGWYADTALAPTLADAIAITSGETTFKDVIADADIAVLNLRAWWTENTPAITANYGDEVLTNLAPNATYIINGTEYTADGDGEIEIDDDWFNTTISIVKDAVGDYTFDSDAYDLSLNARPIAPYSTLADDVTYTGAQAFTLHCDDDNVTIYYCIIERNETGDSSDNYTLVDGGEYDTTHTYYIKETSSLVIYSVNNTTGLKSAEVTLEYVIEPNLTVSYEDGVDETTQMISTINSTNEDNDGWIANSTLENFGLIRIDDEDATDDTIVTNAERLFLNEAMPSGYSEVSAFQLHATVNDEAILDTVELNSRVTIVIDVPDMSSRKTYQVLHMKHGADGSDDVELFSTTATNEDLLLVVDTTNKTLTLSVDSLSPFMVTSKTVSSVTPSGGSSTTTPVLDTENHFAYMQGYADSTFRPDNNITRAQAIVMFSRLLTEHMDSNTTYTSSFSDVNSDLWYANAVGFMEEYGIINGYSDGTFRGDSYITRAQFAAIASRFDDLDTTGELPFSDVDESHWASDYISSASAKGWINGYTDGTFRPDNYITRAQAVTMVNRVLARSCDEDFVATNLDDLTTYLDVSASYWAYYNILEATNGHEYTITDGAEIWSELK